MILRKIKTLQHVMYEPLTTQVKVDCEGMINAPKKTSDYAKLEDFVYRGPPNQSLELLVRTVASGNSGNGKRKRY